MSADVSNAPLVFRLSNGLGLRGTREDSCVLPFMQPCQQHDLAIGEFECVVIHEKRTLIDLAKDRNGVAGSGKEKGGLILDWLLERELGARKYANSHRTILRSGKSSRASTEVVCDEFFAHFGWAISHGVATRRALQELREATTQAVNLLQSDCPTYRPLTVIGRVEVMEQRLAAMLHAVDLVQPALARFYGSLSDEQKERFNRLSPSQS
jgi:hypothetical protein